MKIAWSEPKQLAASGIPLSAKDMYALHEQDIRAILALMEQPLFIHRDLTSTLADSHTQDGGRIPSRSRPCKQNAFKTAS